MAFHANRLLRTTGLMDNMTENVYDLHVILIVWLTISHVRLSGTDFRTGQLYWHNTAATSPTAFT